MPSHRSFGEDRNAALRDVVRKIVDERFDGNSSATAKALGLSPAALHDFLAGSRGAGMKLLDGLVALTGKSIESLLGRPAPSQSNELTVERPDRYPNRAAVIELFKNDVHPRAIDLLREEYTAFHGEDPTRKEWTDWLFAFDARVRREELKGPAPVAPKGKKRPT